MSEEKELVEIELTDAQIDSLLDGLDDSGIEDVEDILFNERVIYLQGEVSQDTVNNIVPLIHYYNILDEQNEVEPSQRQPIKLHINSEGGEIYNGTHILSVIESSKTPVWTFSEGTIGMSMSFLLFLAGKKRHMSRHSFLLYHELRGGSETKTLAEMRNMIEHYGKLQDNMDKYIVERTSIPMKKLKAQRKKNLDWYIDFETAKRYEMFDVEI